jgi:hypothetical protein
MPIQWRNGRDALYSCAEIRAVGPKEPLYTAIAEEKEDEVGREVV